MARTARKSAKKNDDMIADAGPDLGYPAPADADDDFAAEAAAAKEAAEAARREEILDLSGRMKDTLHALTVSDATSAVEARLAWVKVGELLIEAREKFTLPGSNTVNDKAFGGWIKENGFTAIGARPTRAGAIWLAQVYNTKPTLFSLFPTSSENGEPLKRSPRTLQAWVRDQIVAAFQDAWEAAPDSIGIASEADKDQRDKVAKESLPNIHAALREQIENAQALEAAAKKRLDTATPAERKAAADDFMSASAIADGLRLRQAIIEQHTEDELVSLFVAWKPKRQAVAFKDCPVDEAARRLMNMLKSREDFSEVYAALGVLVDDLKAKVAADFGDLDNDNGDSDSDEDGDDWDVDIDEDEPADA